jgi:hypothetical protein
MPESALACPKDRRLTPKQEDAALALASGCTIESAAKRSGAAPRTIKLWLATISAFRCRIDQLRAEMTERALGVLAASAASAASTLASLMLTATSEPARIASAKAVLDMLLRVRETVALEERICALEEAQAGKPSLRARA